MKVTNAIRKEIVRLGFIESVDIGDIDKTKAAMRKLASKTRADAKSMNEQADLLDQYARDFCSMTPELPY